MSDNAKNASGKPLSLVWLRRDLRLFDHAAFAEAAKLGAPAQAVFVFDSAILARFRHKTDRRLTFIAQAICRLHGQLQAKGGGVLVLHGQAETLIPRLCEALHATTLIAARDFEPATAARDKRVGEALGSKTAFTLPLDHLLTAPQEVVKEDGTPFKVFTPYANAWRNKVAGKHFAAEHPLKGLHCADYGEIAKRLAHAGMPLLDPAIGVEAMLDAIGYLPATHGWPVDKARQKLHAFAEASLHAYGKERDFMAHEGTSKLSPYLRFGLLSVRECARIALGHEAQGSAGASVWLKELIWRDFYAMILHYHPETPDMELQEQYRGLGWAQDKALFEAFTEGKTGYPIVDAAMRQLLQLGWMHNRARMIVASFMTKDLLLDWRLGEEHFAQHLMDYELSSNVGGWQWAASTGTDAQPYFRVFNPLLQSRKFDPDGVYIRRYIPELASVAGDAIHQPWTKPSPQGYPMPVVDHKEAREKAIALFKKVKPA